MDFDLSYRTNCRHHDDRCISWFALDARSIMPLSETPEGAVSVNFGLDVGAGNCRRYCSHQTTSASAQALMLHNGFTP